MKAYQNLDPFSTFDFSQYKLLPKVYYPKLFYFFIAVLDLDQNCLWIIFDGQLFFGTNIPFIKILILNIYVRSMESIYFHKVQVNNVQSRSLRIYLAFKVYGSSK